MFDERGLQNYAIWKRGSYVEFYQNGRHFADDIFKCILLFKIA